MNRQQRNLDNLEDLDLLQGNEIGAGEVCLLCQRQRPIFLVDSDDMILRLPERFLPAFLKSLKQDYLNKRQYLKFLRINSKFIKLCACQHKVAHAYCTTAFVLRSQIIYCKDCYSYYHLYVKSERIFSSEYIGSMLKLFLMFLAFSASIYGIFFIDRYLKGVHIHSEMVEENAAKGLQPLNVTVESVTKKVENSFVMVPLAVVLTVIMIWCFYLRFVMAFMRRKRLVWVEVQDFQNSDYTISRNEAKENLHLVGEITQKLKSYNSLFDKYWYR